MNILTFDIEEWYIEQYFNGGQLSRYKQFDDYLYRILDTLDEQNLKATFFCVGELANKFSYTIKEIAKRGHEIGCHSNTHLWLTKMTPDELKVDTMKAICSLQEYSGTKVKSYRAPAFSICERNKWAFEVLAECGIECDSSVYPSKRDFGGFPSFPIDKPVIIECNEYKIKEFPIRLCHLGMYDFAFSGGGYFRFFPYDFIKHEIEKSTYSIVYFHIADLIHNQGKIMTKYEYETYFKEEGSLCNRLKRYIKSNLGTKCAFEKMVRLLSTTDFMNIAEAEKEIDWESVTNFKL